MIHLNGLEFQFYRRQFASEDQRVASTFVPSCWKPETRPTPGYLQNIAKTLKISNVGEKILKKKCKLVENVKFSSCFFEIPEF